MVTPGQADLTVDALARRVGMTVRNVRAHQARGLLPPPEVRGRIGYYGEDHVARLELIKDMQADGFNLRAIRHALDALPEGAGPEALEFRRRVVEPWSDEEPEIVETEVLAELLGEDSERLLAEAEKLGTIRRLDADRVEILSPALVRAAGQVVRFGVPLDDVMKVQRELNRHVDAVARAYVRLFLEHVWHPFVIKDAPAEMWPAVREALDGLQPIAGEVLQSTFRLRMERAITDAVGHELLTPPERGRGGGRASGRGSGRGRRRTGVDTS